MAVWPIFIKIRLVLAKFLCHAAPNCLVSKWEFKVDHTMGIDSSCCAKSLVLKWEFEADHTLGLEMEIQSGLCCENQLFMLYQKFGEFEVNCIVGINNSCCAESLVLKCEFKADCAARIDYSCYGKR
ncbi:hypothetical protein C1645_735105 [Glomus cerebriforme]|uniref:Uncharacterized protein n=1 Tax=Glomus cerebriforme TaxID=658196 RepID=A0A397TCH2_9GLOM|nr:hypothetical protein C1645_735105 [Glomus cerebriforme]